MNELYICGKDGDCFILLSHCFELFVASQNVIRAVPVSGQVIKLGDYPSYDIACAVLHNLLAHAPAGGVYQLPNDEQAQALLRSYSPASPDKFASNGKKPTRRGGS